jgi:transposase
MARRLVTMNEIVEMIYQWHHGKSLKGIQRSLGVDRNTVRKYIEMAQAAGVRSQEPFPEETELIGRIKALTDTSVHRERPAQDLILPYRDWIEGLLKAPHMTAKQVWRLFKEEKGISIGYCTMKRYLRSQFQFGAPAVTVRMEVDPGSQAQVDLGYVGKMADPATGKLRKTWVFIMTLSYSRHRFVRFIFCQDVKNWIDCHRRAFEFFGGVPATVVIDNLKTGVIKADLYDPTLNRAYAEMERHYGFLIDPTKVGAPRHKGKVERSVPVVRQHLLAGRTFLDPQEANQRALVWCKEEIGMQVHGTTQRKPWEVFVGEEGPQLKPLPTEPFECPQWKPCTVHPDHHIVFDRSYYSLPSRYIGREVWARGDSKLLQIFLQEERIKTHVRAEHPGTWRTDPSDYPPQKLAYLMATPTYCRNKAQEVGPQTEALIRKILSDHAMRNLRKAQAILRLSEKYGQTAMEAAAQRALLFGNFHYRSIKTILEKGWLTPVPTTPKAVAPLSPLGQRFLRSPQYFAHPDLSAATEGVMP